MDLSFVGKQIFVLVFYISVLYILLGPNYILSKEKKISDVNMLSKASAIIQDDYSYQYYEV